MLPWTRLSHAALSTLNFKLRLSIEGVPPHGRQLETVAPLLPKESLSERLDLGAKNVVEAACCCVWVWEKDPDPVAKAGMLRLEAVSERAYEVWRFTRDGTITERQPRPEDQVNMLTFNVLLHLDQAIDFKPAAPAEQIALRCANRCTQDWDLARGIGLPRAAVVAAMRMIRPPRTPRTHASWCARGTTLAAVHRHVLRTMAEDTTSASCH